jgi:sugar lactone lactonase YvrE
MTADAQDSDSPLLYVSNVRTGTVTRISTHVSHDNGKLKVTTDHMTQVASGFAHRSDPNAVVVGPTGLLLGPDRGSLYVADTGNNRIQLVHGVRDTQSDQGSGETVVSGAPLKGPLALAQSPSGTIIASNGDAAGSANTPDNINRVVEFDPRQHASVTSLQLDNSGVAGAIFGITIPTSGRSGLYYVNDNTTTLDFLPAQSRGEGGNDR